MPDNGRFVIIFYVKLYIAAKMSNFVFNATITKLYMNDRHHANGAQKSSYK